MKQVKRELWEVYRDYFLPSAPWKVKGPCGIIGFRLKRDALSFSDANKQIDANNRK